MKLDMHCHTKEGSIDAKTRIADYIRQLKEKGYDGMLVSDHDSYNGYRKYRDTLKGKLEDFTVFKGIEYDTLDAGHILVILPEGVKLLILECRGLPVKLLQEIVHRHGGALGPAHPCGERHMSIARTRAYKRNPDIMRGFDFLEGFNACETEQSNAQAMALAEKYRLPTVGGSDAHRDNCIGTAYTELEGSPSTESELIAYLKAKKPVSCGGEIYQGTVKGKLGFLHPIMSEGFWVYNHVASASVSRKRKQALSLLHHRQST